MGRVTSITDCFILSFLCSNANAEIENRYPVSLYVFRLAPDLLSYYLHVLEYAKIRIVLVSKRPMSLVRYRVLNAFGRASSKISFLRTFNPPKLFDYSLIAITSSCLTICTYTRKWSGQVKATPVPSRQK